MNEHPQVPNDRNSKLREDDLHKYIEDSIFIGSNSDMYPIFCGYGKCKEKNVVIGNRNYYLLCCVGNGHGVFRQHGEEYQLGAGWAFMLFPNIHTEYCADLEYPWEYSWIAFEGDNVTKHLRGAGFSEACPVIDLGSPYVYEKIKSLTITCNSIDTISSVRYLYACGCLYDSIAHMNHIAEDAVTPKSSGLSRHVELALRYMQMKYHENINVTSVAYEVGLSREYFSLLFKKEMNMTPIDYLIDLKIKRAQHLLSSTTLSVREISDLSGFDDYHYFSRKFKEISYISPSKYRMSKK